MRLGEKSRRADEGVGKSQRYPTQLVYTQYLSLTLDRLGWYEIAMASDLMQLRILRRPEVEHVTGLSRASLYRLIAQRHFPAPVRLTTGNAVGWRESAIREWLESREPVELSNDAHRGRE